MLSFQSMRKEAVNQPSGGRLLCKSPHQRGMSGCKRPEAVGSMKIVASIYTNTLELRVLDHSGG
jgi:hypothetical protein